MTFSISDREFWDLVLLEEETNCDVSAGINLGPHLGKYLANNVNYTNDHKLVALLQEDLSSILSPEEIEAMANEV